ncbi:MAG: cell division topological specificity factor MinE [Deltaproteobacteria bacterium]|nr:cell division topological specificity factor MinE [Deltaproteobacteria bacterium]
MRNLFDRLFRPRPRNSKDDAKARLKVLLIHDQVDLTPAQMERMKREIMDVITRYVEVDDDNVQFRLNREEGSVALVSSVPVRRVTARAS